MRIYKVLIIVIFSTTLHSDAFDKNCIECHQRDRQLNMFINRYTLKYSSPRRIKEAIFRYIKNPTSKTSVMPRGFLNRWGLKKKSFLSDIEIKKSIDDYYKRYNIRDIFI